MSQEKTATAEATAQQAGPAGNPAPGASMAPVELTVQDLGVVRSIIDVASQRGAFKANELEAVGKTFNKLDTFLQQVQKQEEAAAKGETKETEGGK